MMQRDSLSIRRLLLPGLLLFVMTVAEAQPVKKPKPNKPKYGFLDTQFWLGVKFGTNFANPMAQSQLSGFSPIDYPSDRLTKTYDSYVLPGGQAGIEMTFYHRGFSVGLHPMYQRSRYRYTNSLEWNGEQESERFATIYESEQRVDVINVPIFVKYDLIQDGKLRPFVLGGGFYSFLVGAERQVKITQTDYSFGAPQTIDGGTLNLGVKDAFQNYYGWVAGGGASFDYWNIRTVIEITYNQSLNSVTREGTSQNELSSLGDQNDDVHLSHIVGSVSFVFPLRFIDKQFQAL
ncbi:Outer membrane protein beta-barrel domain-containing protein [Imperialibacter sp. EC-SDR9]|nr:Outer membrane protein beta-barrel domain-containing protein [Imperialibacter sp. 75]CAD5298105.1 Outer membrane protein beta-barrel domain-containing protein [Imperialibacter sp. 89]VVT13345.1 Outer membrane protein beta-barrel domain-containing protein [Imperialibacter sp. EC-SDR9]